MDDYLIDFKNMEWETPAIGVKEKKVVKNNQRIRLVRFEEDFIEKDWCTAAHMGYVLKGEMTINFNGDLVIFKKGDGLFIKEGLVHKHKAVIEKGKFVELVLFEKVKA